MKFFFSGFLFLVAFFPFSSMGQMTRILKKNLVLQMPDEGISNGAAVAWHPEQKKYYAAFAGKSSSPLAVFDAFGKRISPENTKTLTDVRGLWYNSNTKHICGNGFNENGWFCYKLDAKGIPMDLDLVLNGQYQPTPQSVGAFNAKNQFVYFIHNNTIVAYNNEGKQVEDSAVILDLKIPEEFKDKSQEYLNENYNLTTLIYTGIQKSEFGLLNYSQHSIELYDKKTGALSQILKLPENAIIYDWLNFSFANNIFWLFEKDNRKWVGYK